MERVPGQYWFRPGEVEGAGCYPSMPETVLTLPSCFSHSVEMTLFLHLFLGSLLFQSPEGGSLKTWPP